MQLLHGARPGGLWGVKESVLENAEIEFSTAFREALYTIWQHYLNLRTNFV